jgi:hypothetical protein
MKKSALVLSLLVGSIFLSLPAYADKVQHSAALSQTVGGGETVPLELGKRVATSLAGILSISGPLGPVYT